MPPVWAHRRTRACARAKPASSAAHRPRTQERARAKEGASGHARAILLLSVSSSPGFSLWLPALGALELPRSGQGAASVGFFLTRRARRGAALLRARLFVNFGGWGSKECGGSAPASACGAGRGAGWPSHGLPTCQVGRAKACCREPLAGRQARLAPPPIINLRCAPHILLSRLSALGLADLAAHLRATRFPRSGRSGFRHGHKKPPQTNPTGFSRHKNPIRTP